MITRGPKRPGSIGRLVLVGRLAAVVVASPARAGEAGADSETELAKKTQNPVADLISVPFQNNFNFGTGPEDRTVWIMNVQPVIPINPSFFLSPAGGEKLIWGLGPTFTLPTASARPLGRGKFSLGPTAVGLTMRGPGWSGRSSTTSGRSLAGAIPT